MQSLSVNAKILALAISVAVVTPLNAGEPSATSVTTAPSAIAALDAAIEQQLRADGIPGAGVVVIDKGQIVFSKSYGVADVASARAVGPDTIFRAGSISKSVTAIGIMRLVEQGRIALDAPVSQLLPEWTVRNPWADGHPLRLVHLLEHTAGLDDIHYRHYLIEGRDTSLTQALSLFGPYKLRWPPGHGTAYSNAGPIAAGRVIETASGQDFERFMATMVTGPLGMPSSRWGRDAAQADQLSTSYQEDGKTPEPFVETPGRPSGSLSSTAADLARLPLLFLGRGEIDGHKLLNRDSVLRMERAGTSVAARVGAPLGWGLGLRADPHGRAVFYGHDGSIDGFVARFAYAPELGAGYVVMANKASDGALKVASKIRAYLERALPPPAVSGSAVSAEQRARWTGQYQSITPRQELLRAVIGLTQWAGARFDGDVLLFERAQWLHRGNGLFQRVDAVAPGLLFLEAPEGMLVHTMDGTKRLVPGWEMLAKLAVMATVAISLFITALCLPVWLLAAVKGGFATRGGASLRFTPALALGSTVLVPFGVLALLSTGDITVLGRPSLWGNAVWLLSFSAPIITMAAAVTIWRQRKFAQAATRVWRWHAILQLVLAAIALAWLHAHGWLGIRIWNA